MIAGFFAPITPSAAGKQELWGPMIRFSLSSSILPYDTHIVETGLIALIDTGTDLCRIDAALAEKYNLDPRGTMPAISGGTQSIVRTFGLQVILDDGTKLQLLCPAVSLRASGERFDLLFGMDAIRFFDLSISRSRQEILLQNFHA